MTREVPGCLALSRGLEKDFVSRSSAPPVSKLPPVGRAVRGWHREPVPLPSWFPLREHRNTRVVMAVRIKYFTKMHVLKDPVRSETFLIHELLGTTCVLHVCIHLPSTSTAIPPQLCRSPECVMSAWFVCDGLVSATEKKVIGGDFARIKQSGKWILFRTRDRRVKSSAVVERFNVFNAERNPHVVGQRLSQLYQILNFLLILFINFS